MALNLIMTEQKELTPRITVFGVGGAGGNAVNNMIDKQLEGVEFVVANTDAQALQQSKATYRIQIGVKVTEGLGAGARPAVGAAAAEETLEEIIDHLAGAHMCFITAGMGGGTGTGAAPIIAQAARELGVLTVGVVTKPFQFEGAKRMRQAEEGVEALQKVVDTLIIIPNQNLFRLANEKTTFTEAFAMADDVLYQGVKGVTDLMVKPGLINLDFADVRAVMDEMGKAMMGTGEASGENRAVEAAEKAIANPLLDEISLHGAKGVLINITGGTDITLFELDEAANRIREKVDPDANIIVGSTLEPEMSGTLRVSVVATGIDAKAGQAEVPVPRRRMADPIPETRIAPDAELYDPAPQRRHHPPAAQAPEPVQQYEPEPEEERSFYGDYVARDQNDLFGDIGAEQEEVPVYRTARSSGASQQARHTPVHPQPRPQSSAAIGHNDHPADFVAPQSPRRAPGEPSPEALQRLQAAINRGSPDPRPEEARVAAPRQDAPPRPHGGVARTPAPEPDRGGAAGGRFGINSLINRMTGHGQPSEAERPSMRRQPPQVAAYDDEQDGDSERARVEIPAFMRRQAN